MIISLGLALQESNPFLYAENIEDSLTKSFTLIPKLNKVPTKPFVTPTKLGYLVHIMEKICILYNRQVG